MTRPEPVITASEEIQFPKIYFAIKWTIITSLIVMGLLAAAFWVLVLGEFSASGFRAPSPIAVTDESSGYYAGVCMATKRGRTGRQGSMPDVL